jgi:hypothetical protein
MNVYAQRVHVTQALFYIPTKSWVQGLSSAAQAVDQVTYAITLASNSMPGFSVVEALSQAFWDEVGMNIYRAHICPS